MQLAMVGLGRMGRNLVRRLRQHDHDVLVYDINPEAANALVEFGASPLTGLSEIGTSFQDRRVVWIMVPSAVTSSTIDTVSDFLSEGDVIIDGGNSHFKNDLAIAQRLHERGIHFVDVGTSGGIFGLERGYSLMIGGNTEVVDSLAPIFDALAPGPHAAERTPSRNGDFSPEERGWLHCGSVGAGHFVKMIHNGIEYGMMQSLAEGLALLDRYPSYDLDIPAIAEVWRRGSVISSWLLDLTAESLAREPNLERFAGIVPDSGEGRWTVDAAVESATPIPVLSASLWARFSSRNNDEFANKVLSAMRESFGGHSETS